ncbi:putative pseudouridine synthase [Porphyridium purpureum]|uniref:Putative pseudouridine synthase n=1 Tax=Porphyridium purpureum TaxID=35688 RepID=A0A5J4YSD7_PORPP|nr:putative pseudouridine synthase [Porphyridium purpureum]|eukprot:POR4501..scf229_5
MNVEEAGVGIVAFVSDHEPFSALVRDRFADFVVREIAPDGRVAALPALAAAPALVPAPAPASPQAGGDVPQPGKPAAPRADQEDQDGDENCKGSGSQPGHSEGASVNHACADAVSIDMPAASPRNAAAARDDGKAVQGMRLEPDAQLAELIGVERALQLAELARDGAHAESKTRFVVIEGVDKIDDKAFRRALHLAVREAHAQLDSAVQEHGGVKRILVTFQTSAQRKRKPDSSDPGTDRVSKRVNYHVADVEFVLAKRNRDTHDVLCSVAKLLNVPVSRLSTAGTKDKRAITFQFVVVRGFSPERILQLNGALRDARVGNANLAKTGRLALGDLLGNKFTIVLRALSGREKSEDDVPHLRSTIERAIRNVSTRGFINYFGLQRFGSGAYATHVIGFEVLRNDFAKACRMIMTPFDPTDGDPSKQIYPEREAKLKVMHSFLDNTISAQEALRTLPACRGNGGLEKRLLESYSKQGGIVDHKAAFSAIPFNLRKMYVHAVQSFLWNSMATVRMQPGRCREYAEPGDLVVANKVGDLDVASSFEVDLSFRAQVRVVQPDERNQISIHQVVLPMVGYDVLRPAGEVGEALSALLEKHKVDLSAANSAVTEFNLIGSYRRLLSFAQDVQFDFVTYCNEKVDLISTELPVQVPTSASRAAVTMSATSVPVDSAPGGDMTAGPERLALILNFTLRPAAYATMFIRELTKQDSDAKASANARPVEAMLAQ